MATTATTSFAVKVMKPIRLNYVVQFEEGKHTAVKGFGSEDPSISE